MGHIQPFSVLKTPGFALRITPGGFKGILWGARDWTQAGFEQAKDLPPYYFSGPDCNLRDTWQLQEANEKQQEWQMYYSYD